MVNDFLIKAINTITTKIVEEKCGDKTFPSVVYGLNNERYTIIKDNQKYEVKCALGTTLSLGTKVWVKIPCGRLHDMHICGLR